VSAKYCQENYFQVAIVFNILNRSRNLVVLFILNLRILIGNPLFLATDEAEKIEHVRPLTKELLLGMGLPMIIAMLINLKEVNHIITARLEPGDIKLPSESLKEKKVLIRDHFDEIDGGIDSEDIQAYTGMVLKTSRSRGLKESLGLANLI
jgi:hypothetical protein